MQIYCSRQLSVRVRGYTILHASGSWPVVGDPSTMGSLSSNVSNVRAFKVNEPQTGPSKTLCRGHHHHHQRLTGWLTGWLAQRGLRRRLPAAAGGPNTSKRGPRERDCAAGVTSGFSTAHVAGCGGWRVQLAAGMRITSHHILAHAHYTVFCMPRRLSVVYPREQLDNVHAIDTTSRTGCSGDGVARFFWQILLLLWLFQMHLIDPRAMSRAGACHSGGSCFSKQLRAFGTIIWYISRHCQTPCSCLVVIQNGLVAFLSNTYINCMVWWALCGSLSSSASKLCRIFGDIPVFKGSNVL